MKTLRCRDVGFDCAAVMRGDSDEEILRQAAEHVKTVHNLSEISEQAVVRIRALIRDETPPLQNVTPR
jgi:predicted small metal-binding protein